ncbi:MAG: PQQ-binding-like beta-propeller repeat protein, partial [Planctomycetota bacterium]
STFAWAADPGSDESRFWPQWRGPDATGVANHADPPIEWSKNKNIRWKTEIPGEGHATPIVWGKHVFIQTAIETDKSIEPKEQGESPETDPDKRRSNSIDRGPKEGARQSMSSQPPDRPRRGQPGGRGPRRQAVPTHAYRFAVLAIDRRNGKVVWEKTLCEEVPHTGVHSDSTQASNSPVTDGEHLFAYFGSRGLYCLDMEGNLKWKKDLGDMQTRNSFGEGSSPVLHGDTIVANWDHEGDSFIVALDKKTGKQLWKVDRDEPTSWATPIVVQHDGKPQVVAAASNLTRGYDLTTGKLIWQCGGLTSNVISSPVSGFDMVFVMSGHRGFSLQAIRYGGATGDITDSEAVVWTYDEDTPYVPSPLLYGDTLYFLKRTNAILSCFDAKTGKPHYTRQRLEGIEDVYASPVGAHDRVYIVGRNGTTKVAKRGPKFETLATNSLDDTFAASPAIAGNELYLRGNKHLYCIAAD